VTRVLVTGMSGVGKSSLLQELSARGDPAEVAETLDYLESVEPLLREAATLEVITTVPVAQVADIVIAHCL
jgi:hypothetical protein